MVWSYHIYCWRKHLSTGHDFTYVMHVLVIFNIDFSVVIDSSLLLPLLFNGDLYIRKTVSIYCIDVMGTNCSDIQRFCISPFLCQATVCFSTFPRLKLQWWMTPIRRTVCQLMEYGRLADHFTAINIQGCCTKIMALLHNSRRNSYVS